MEKHEYRSSQINEIASSLSEAQGSYKKMIPNESGSFGAYANLQATLEAVQPALKDNGLSFNQFTELTDWDGTRLVWSFLMHKSGQWLSSCDRITFGENDIDNGKRLEVVKRRQAQMLLGIAPSAHDPYCLDDDGESSFNQTVFKDALRPVDHIKKEARHETISKADYDRLMAELELLPAVVKSITKSYGLDTLADLPKIEFSKVMAKILKIKATAAEHAERKDRVQ